MQVYVVSDRGMELDHGLGWQSEQMSNAVHLFPGRRLA